MALCFASVLSAAQGTVHYSIGVRYELASWDFKGAYYYKTWDDYLNDVRTEFGSEMGNLFGPTASISYEKFGFSVTYLLGSWKFPKYPYWWSDGFYIYEDEVTETSKRSDLVITASYQIIPRLSVFVGFKNLSLKTEYRFRDNTSFDSDATATGSGAGGGLSGSLPFTLRLHGYATVGYMKLGGDLDTENIIAEGGLRLYFGNAPLFGSLGYRYESFDSGDTILHGPILTVAFYK